MMQLALLASMCVAEPPKEKYVSGIVTEVGKGSVTLDKAGAFRLSKETQYLRETGRDPMEVGPEALDKGKSVTLTVVDGVVVRVFIDRFVPLTPDELVRFNRVIADERLNGLIEAMDGFRKKLPEPQGRGEMNGLGVEDIHGVSHPDSHLTGIAKRLGAATKAECMVLLTYLKDPDPKIRRIAAFAIEGVVKAYPGGMSSEDMQRLDSEGHRKMVKAFIVGIEKLK